MGFHQALDPEDSTANTETLTGVGLDYQTPDRDGEPNSLLGAGGSGALLLDTDEALPLGTAVGTIVARITGIATLPTLVPPVAVTSGATSAVVVSATNIVINKPTGVTDGNLLVAVVTHQQAVGALAITAPVGWVVLQTLLAPAGQRCTVILGLAVPSAAALTATSFTFGTSAATAGRMVGGMFRVTGADLASLVAGTSAAPVENSTTVLTIPTFDTDQKGYLLVTEVHGQFVTPNVGTPVATGDTGDTLMLGLASSTDTGTTRTYLDIFTRADAATLTVPANVATWPGVAAGLGGSTVAIRGLEA